MKKIFKRVFLLSVIFFSVICNLKAEEAAVATEPASPAVTAPTPDSASSPAPSQEKLADIRKLIVLTGGEELGKQMIVDIIESFKERFADVPSEFWNEFLEGNDAQLLIDSNIAIYDKYLSQSEIQDIIKFYEAPSGQKLIEVLPRISQDSYTSGEQWGYDLGKKIRDRLIEKGYINEPALDNQSSAPAEAPVTPLEIAQ